MTPARRAEFEALVDALEDAVRHHLFNAQSTSTRHAARAALTAFVEREEGALSFDGLRAVNVARCEAAFFPLDSWRPEQWSNAMAGECGEVCNLTKKMLRGDTIPIEEVAKELADVVTYADLLAARLGIDLGDAVARKFNEVSARWGVDILLDVPNA